MFMANLYSRKLKNFKILPVFFILTAIFLIFPFQINAAVKFSVSLPTNSQDFLNIAQKIETNIKTTAQSIQSRISQVSLVSPNLLLSPYHSLNLEEETKANEETLSFLEQSTKKEILAISSKISLVRVEKNDLKPKLYLKSFYQSSSKKIDELAKVVKPKNRETALISQSPDKQAFIHESILKNIKETVKETLPSLPSLPSLFSKKINEDKNNKTEETTISQKTKA